MGTLNALYLRADDGSFVRAELSQGLAHEQVIPESHPARIGFQSKRTQQFTREAQPAPRVPTARLEGLSRESDSDVIWLSFQSVVDAFGYAHWRSGVCLRELVYGYEKEERTWERVHGEAEPWEREALFGGGPQVSFGPGDTEPQLDARETARAVADHFDLPGW
jgi:hypothetical protein